MTDRPAWNKDRLIGQKLPLKPQEIWSLRIRLQLAGRTRDLAILNLALDSKLRGCDLVSLRVQDICRGEAVAARASILQRKTHRPVQFEITDATRDAWQPGSTRASSLLSRICFRAASESITSVNGSTPGS